VVALLLCGCSAQARTFDEAVSAYAQNRVSEAEAAFRALAEAPNGAASERARAYRELARISWHIDGDGPKALALIGKADALGEGRCGTAKLLARVLQEGDGDARLLEEAGALMQRCETPGQAAPIRMAAANAALDLSASGKPIKEAAFAQAKALVAGLDEEASGSLEGASLRLQLSLLEGDAQRALAAWKDYFWLIDRDVPQGLAGTYPAAAPVFEAALSAGADPVAKLTLVDLLVRAGFAVPARRFSEVHALDRVAGNHPLRKKAAAYFAAREALQAEVLQSNRKVARGGTAADLAAATGRMKEALLQAVGQAGKGDAALQQAYGIRGFVGDTDGFESVHYGHVVQNERLLIAQYGHQADAAFVTLDNMISNGFGTWLWDGRAATGGFAEADQTILQVRPEWTTGPLLAWRLFTGAADRKELIERQKELAAADESLVRGRGVAYLAGLADRLNLQAADQIGARVRALGGSGELRRAFLQEYWRASFQHSMVAHEGRHALDKKLVRGLARLNDANLEYRAKLSELALAEYPRLALRNINEPAIGSGSAHGKANKRLLGELGAWVDTNRRSVAGFDPKLPALVQLDRLTDDQLRSIARSLEPILAKP
jgi:hypothetical protein